MSGHGGYMNNVKWWTTPKAYGPDALDREPPEAAIAQWGRWRKQVEVAKTRRAARKKRRA